MIYIYKIKNSNQSQQISSFSTHHINHIITEPSFYTTRASFRHFVVSRIFFLGSRDPEPSTWFGCTDRSWTRCPGALRIFVSKPGTPLGHWKYQMKYQIKSDEIKWHFGLLEWSVHNIWLLREWCSRWDNTGLFNTISSRQNGTKVFHWFLLVLKDHGTFAVSMSPQT
jgi:hypothetical protein